MTDLYAPADWTAQVAAGVVGVSFLLAMIRAMFRAIGGRKPRA